MRAHALLLAGAVALVACALDRSGVGERVQGAGAGAGTGGMEGHGGHLFGGGGFATLCDPGSKKDCYSGPPETAGKGICKVGLQICSSNGQSYGACVGGTVPAAEQCATPVDESCDGEASCTGTPGYALAWTETGTGEGLSIAVDAQGNVVLGAKFDGSIDFGTATVTSAGGHDVLVAKFDPEGKLVWAKAFGDDAEQTDVHVAVDTKGNVLLAGRLFGTMDFGGGPLSEIGKGDVYVAKLDSKGGLLWSHAFGDAEEQFAEGIAADASGNAIVIGTFQGELDFAGTKVASAGNAYDVYAAKLDPKGDVLWAKRWGEGTDQRGLDVVTAAADEVLITGTSVGPVDLGGGELPAGGEQDVFVAKLSAGGDHIWSKRYGAAGEQIPAAVRVAPGGLVVVAGTYTGTVNFGDGDHVAADGEPDMFVMKLDPNGATQWSRVVSAQGTQALLGAAADGAGNVVTCGRYHGAVDFGTGIVDSPGGDFDVFVTKRQPDGAPVWAQRFYETDMVDTDQVARALAVDSGGRVFFTGGFQGTLAVGKNELVGDAKDMHLFLARLAP